MSWGALGPDDGEYADEPERSKVGMYAVIVAVLLALLVGLGLYLKGVVSPDDPVEAPTIEVPTLSGGSICRCWIVMASCRKTRRSKAGHTFRQKVCPRQSSRAMLSAVSL